MNRIGPDKDGFRPTVVTFGGGKGGVGRTTLCAEVARSLARRGEQVLCVDAALDAPQLHAYLDEPEPTGAHDRSVPPLGGRDGHVADYIAEAEDDDLWWVSLASGRPYPFAEPKLEAGRLLDQLHALDFDWVLVDLPAGTGKLQGGLFALSDVPLLVTTPEPAAIRACTQFLRQGLFESTLHHPEAADAGRGLEETLRAQPLDLSIDTLLDAAADPHARRVVERTADQFEPYLVVNRVREGAEQDLGFVVGHAWQRAVGVFPRLVGSVDYENRRWFYHRRTTGSETVRGEEPLSRDIETVAELLLDISVVDDKYPRPVPRGDDVHPARRLGLSENTSRNEVRQHCRRLWEGYKRERAVDLIFADSTTRSTIAEELEEMYRRVLTLPSDTFDSVQESADPSTSELGLASNSSDAHASSSGTHRARTASGSTAADPSPSSGPSDPESPPDVETTPDESTEDEDESTDDTSRASADADDREETREENGDDRPLPASPEPGAREPGDLVEKLRRRHSVSLQELSRRTQIGVKYLTAVEDADIDALPRPVYLRGYLRDIARVFDVDGDALVDEYVALLDREIEDDEDDEDEV